MLYIDPSTKFPVRIQAPFVTTEEIEKIVMNLKNKYMEGLDENDIYNQEIVNMLENKMEMGDALFSGGSA
jgi:DNA segregation ATPase FtsK/SpoIIIE-like protein